MLSGVRRFFFAGHALLGGGGIGGCAAGLGQLLAGLASHRLGQFVVDHLLRPGEVPLVEEGIEAIDVGELAVHASLLEGLPRLGGQERPMDGFAITQTEKRGVPKDE